MHLARPEWLWFLAALPLLAARSLAGRKRQARAWSALGQSGRPAADHAVAWLLAAVVLSLALARPQWGRSDEPPLPAGHDVVIAVDVSRSMGAGDAVPDRLGLAVESAVSLVSALGREAGDRAAVVAFAGRGVLRCPLTRNLGAAVDALRSLRPGDLRPGGTDLAAPLDTALDAFDDQDRSGGRSVVLISDGEDHAGHALDAAERLRARGIVVHTVAVGDDAVGHPAPNRPGPDSEPIRYQGSVVLSKRTDEPLASIARATGGAFVPLGLATTDLGRLFQTRIEPVAGGIRRSPLAAERAERFPLFLLAALGFVLAASWRGRPRLPVLRGLVGLLALTLLGGSPAVTPAEAIDRGRALYAAGRPAEALDAFRVAMRLAPRNPVPAYDAASALFQLGRFAEARALYQSARSLAGAALRTKADFALGNTALALGDVAGAIRHYDDCITSTATGSDLDRIRNDAAINRRFAEEHAPRNNEPSPPEPPGKGHDARGQPSADPQNQAGQGSGAGQPDTEPGSSPGRRGAGGAGGSGVAPPRPGSPEAQLSEALDNVRQARRRRIEEANTSEDREDRKDW